MFDEKTEAGSNLALWLDLACRLYSQCKLWCWLSVSLSLRLSSLLEPLPSHQRKPRVRKRAWDFQLDELSSLLPILSLWTYFILLNSIYMHRSILWHSWINTLHRRLLMKIYLPSSWGERSALQIYYSQTNKHSISEKLIQMIWCMSLKIMILCFM